MAITIHYKSLVENYKSYCMYFQERTVLKNPFYRSYYGNDDRIGVLTKQKDVKHSLIN